MFKHNIHIMVLCLFVSGCASTPNADSDNPAIHTLIKKDVGSIDEDLATRIMTEKVPYRSRARDRIEKEMRTKVWWWVNYFSTRERAIFSRALERGEKYRDLVQNVLKEHQLPPELYYLAMIESGYVNHARSQASAVGIWQFMRPTALHYGLGVEGVVDERKHPVAATHAAAGYLTYLYQRFDSWYLAIAAYNAGQGRISKAIKRGKTTDFWELVDRNLLPQETMDYIPKFLAAATIGNHREAFGFRIKDEKATAATQWTELKPVNVKRGQKISTLAAHAEISEAELININPEIKKFLKHSKKKSIRIWVPQNSVSRFDAGKTPRRAGQKQNPV